MAKTKSKNDIKITSIKRGNVVVKKGAKTAVVSKKPRAPKKKLEIEDEVKQVVAEETEIVKKPTAKTTSTPKTTTKKTTNEVKETKLTQEEIAAKRKERNRKKYQNQQKKYQDRKPKNKKKVNVEETLEVKLKESLTVTEEDLVKKVKEKEAKETEPKEKEKKEKEKARKEKRKTNRKSIHLTQTLTNIKEKSVTKINNVKDRANDKHIPVGKTRNDKKRRSKRLIKEAILYAIVLTIIDISCIVIFDYFNFLRLFDIKALNVATTVLIALVFNFFVAFMVDYFVTFVWLKKKRKKKVGEQDGDNGVNKEEHREDIKDKEGE